jgi:nitroreductase
MFPPSWRTPDNWSTIARESESSPLDQTIEGSPTLLIVIYDDRKRAPASEGDVLGFMSLGCVMENIWLTAQALGIGVQIISVVGESSVEQRVKNMLEIPGYMRIAYAVRLGYPISKPSKLLRVRRDLIEIAHHNRFGNKIFV